MGSLAAILDNARAAGLYAHLFDLRSAFIHGRDSVEIIPTHHRVEARRLAAATAAAIVQQAKQTHLSRDCLSREAFLKDLLYRGVELVTGSEANKSTKT